MYTNIHTEPLQESSALAEAEKKISFQRALMGLRERILTGGLAMGDRVSEVALARELGVSRTPVREAMSELVEQGLLERMPTGGCMVRSLTRADVVDGIELRGTIEGLACRLAAERGAPEAGIVACEGILGRIDAALGVSEQETDFERYMELNEQFHQCVAGLSGSGVVQKELERVGAMPMAGPSAFLQGQALFPHTLRSLVVAQDHHRSILDAIRRREGARAAALAVEHARLALRNLDFFLGEGARHARRIPGISLVAGTTVQENDL
ncbi:GntR family transcriptional regulator [Puniceibacterium sediminis]|uniref:Transcriptional regulator, GntR family n=1 Tax=Puniceibacterium sediminis TaxID=1608407 RepID=A0A238XC09_9RHOB|nr:GntR family transcriptional regulator [Puniceibacterium sediminis]SNR56507.1 transcriptional regulator, GntR family [Puniceibacterium sediminis]